MSDQRITTEPLWSRRRALALSALLAGCEGDSRRPVVNITGVLPPLSFAMTRASDGQAVTQAAYRGRVVMLTFGYTSCPDQCPTTLGHLARVLDALGPRSRARALFVSVDPARDTLEGLRSYTAAFSPRIDGLHGSPDAIAMLARRYRVAYSVLRDAAGNTVVSHGSGVFVFDGTGAARLMLSRMAMPDADPAGAAVAVRQLPAAGEDAGA